MKIIYNIYHFDALKNVPCWSYSILQSCYQVTLPNSKRIGCLLNWFTLHLNYFASIQNKTMVSWMSFVVHLKVAKLHYRAAVLICRLFWNIINVMYKAETLYFRPLHKKVLDRTWTPFRGFFFWKCSIIRVVLLQSL